MVPLPELNGVKMAVKKGKYISIAPTWTWVVRMCISLIEDPSASILARSGFIAEASRLGKDAEILLKVIRNRRTSPALRKEAKEFLLERARKADCLIEQKEKTNK